MLNYWLKVASNNNNKLCNVIYRLSRSLYDNNSLESKWLAKIHATLNSIGLGYIWDQDAAYINPEWFKCTIALRLQDMAAQNLNQMIASNGQCILYNALVTSYDTLRPAPYLTQLSRSERLPISKIRCLNNKLPVNLGRIQGIDRNERYCTLCSSSGITNIGDEFHAVLVCPHFKSQRKMYLSESYYLRPNMVKFISLMNSTDKTTLAKLSRLCQEIVTAYNNKSTLNNSS